MIQTKNINIKRLRNNAVLPSYGTEYAVGADLSAAFSDMEGVIINPGETKLIPTGIAVEIPEGYGGFVFARSGLSTKKGLAPANKVGVIDSDYRGEIMVPLYNQSDISRYVLSGDRIAQIVFMPYIKAEFNETDDLEQTDRGTGGFGSTGK